MPNENSSLNSPAPQNIAYFSDGNVLRDIGRIEARLDAHDRNHQALVSGAWVYRKRNSF